MEQDLAKQVEDKLSISNKAANDVAMEVTNSIINAATSTPTKNPNANNNNNTNNTTIENPTTPKKEDEKKQEEKPEPDFVFYDVETTIPTVDILEFGAVVVDRKSLAEKESYETLIFSNKISKESIKANGITFEMVQKSPTFGAVADKIFNLLNGRIWVGHNILTFDNKRIEEQFKNIGKPAPVPSHIVDTLPVLKKTFGARAGNMKMASLGKYFGLGEEKHRALDDVRMTIEVFQKCATVLYLEQHLGFTLDSKSTPATPSSTQSSEKKKPGRKPKSQTSTPAANTITSTPQTPLSSSGNSPLKTTPTKRAVYKPKIQQPNLSQTPDQTINTNNNNANISNNNSNPNTPSKTEAEPETPQTQEIRNKIQQAIIEKRTIWISYNGGSHPKLPRAIAPIGWVNPYTVRAQDVGSQNTIEKSFTLSKILSVSFERQ